MAIPRARLLGVLFAAIAAIALAGCNDSSLPPGGTYSSLQGVVTDAVTHQPVADATVTVDTVLNKPSDANGKFAFDQVPVGMADYQVSAAGYKTITGTVQVVPGKPAAVTIALSH